MEEGMIRGWGESHPGTGIMGRMSKGRSGEGPRRSPRTLSNRASVKGRHKRRGRLLSVRVERASGKRGSTRTDLGRWVEIRERAAGRDGKSRTFPWKGIGTSLNTAFSNRPLEADGRGAHKPLLEADLKIRFKPSGRCPRIAPPPSRYISR